MTEEKIKVGKAAEVTLRISKKEPKRQIPLEPLSRLMHAAAPGKSTIARKAVGVVKAVVEEYTECIARQAKKIVDNSKNKRILPRDVEYIIENNLCDPSKNIVISKFK